MTPWLQELVRASEQLPPQAVDYLASRNVPLATAQAHRIGWCPSGWPVPDGAGPEFLRWQRNSLHDRLLFPLTDPLGRIIGLQTRKLDDKRYLMYYAVNRDWCTPCFGMAQSAQAIVDQQHAVVVEGVFDYMALKAAGCEVGLAQLTAGPTRGMVRFLRRHCRRVTALLDMDEAGRHGVRTLQYELEPHGVSVTAPPYAAHDPGDFWMTGTGRGVLPRLVMDDDLSRALRL